MDLSAKLAKLCVCVHFGLLRCVCVCVVAAAGREASVQWVLGGSEARAGGGGGGGRVFGFLLAVCLSIPSPSEILPRIPPPGALLFQGGCVGQKRTIFN